MIPGLVPVTLTDTLVAVSPTTTLPELGAVKHKVTVYAPEGGVLVVHGLVGNEVGVGEGDGIGVGVWVGVVIGVGVGVLLPFEYTLFSGMSNARIKIADKNMKTRFELINFLPLVPVQAF